MLYRHTLPVVAILLAGLASPATAQFNLLPNGSAGNGIPDFIFDPTSGNITLSADGGPGIGLFQIYSESGIFRGDPAMLPADGLFGVDTDHEIAKAAFSPVTTLNLGNVAAVQQFPGTFLPLDITTAYVSAGFGFPNTALELYCVGNTCTTGPPPGPPIAIDGSISVLAGDVATHQFQYDPNSVHPKDGVLWSDLVLSGDAGQPVAIAASLSADGLFDWDTIGSPVGNYTALATVTSPGGSDIAMLSINVRVPEPASAVLLGVAAAGLAWLRRR